MTTPKRPAAAKSKPSVEPRMHAQPVKAKPPEAKAEPVSPPQSLRPPVQHAFAAPPVELPTYDHRTSQAPVAAMAKKPWWNPF